MIAADVFLPVRSFAGMTRLERVLSPGQRRNLAELMCARVADAATGAGFAVTIVTSDPDVSGWCRERGLETLDDPAQGLSAAAAHAVERAEGRWIVAHADLPLVTHHAFRTVPTSGPTALVPSLDGGTSLISSNGPFPFAYGPGSFHRHLAADPGARVIVTPELMIDLDTANQLRSLTRLAPTLVST